MSSAQRQSSTRQFGTIYFQRPTASIHFKPSRLLWLTFRPFAVQMAILQLYLKPMHRYVQRNLVLSSLTLPMKRIVMMVLHLTPRTNKDFASSKKRIATKRESNKIIHVIILIQIQTQLRRIHSCQKLPNSTLVEDRSKWKATISMECFLKHTGLMIISGRSSS